MKSANFDPAKIKYLTVDNFISISDRERNSYEIYKKVRKQHSSRNQERPGVSSGISGAGFGDNSSIASTLDGRLQGTSAAQNLSPVK